jgi:uncharacterized protein (TIGR03435 family)
MPQFRSAIITPGFDTGPESGLLVNAEGVFTTNNLPLRRLIGFAFDLQDPEITGPPSLDSERYSITAHAEQVPALPQEIDQFRVMTQVLLAQRFAFEFHWETRRSRALALLRSSDAVGLKRAAPSDPGPILRLRDGSSIRVGNAALKPLFTGWLSAQLGVPVLDLTGLTGNYSFDLKWESEEPSAEALKAALLAQLGLTLTATETDIERMVVDRVGRPSDLEPLPIELKIEPAVLDRYVGAYALPRTSIMRISRDGTRLLSQLDGQRPIEIFPASEREFFAKLVPARIQFVVSDAGKATALVLHQGGRTIDAPRLDAQ